MSEPRCRRADEVEYVAGQTSDGLRKGVLLGEEHGGGNLALRRFTLESGGSVPRHTNGVEHEQYVLAGEYTVGIEGETYDVGPGDAVHVPAGAVHWYENDGGEEAAFICAVPAGDDEAQLVED